MYRVVIADDEVIIRMYISEILTNNGFEVVGEAEDGLDAMNICREKHPDFVIMDVNMPILGGLEVAKVINEQNLADFIIILTAYRDKDIVKKAVDIGVMGYVVKPVDEDSLIPAIEVAIDKYKQVAEMKKELVKLQETLNGRKYLDRAKGLLMDQRHLTENEAYAYIRKLAMDKGMPIVDVAKTLINAQTR